MRTQFSSIFTPLLYMLATLASASLPANPPGAQDELVGNFNFHLEIEEVSVGQFAEVSGLSVEREIVEYRDGGELGLVRKLPGHLKYSNITLKRGFVPDRPLREWIWLSLEPDTPVERRDGALSLRDRAGNELVRYEFTQGWPCKWSGATVAAQSDSAFVEELVICIDSFRELLPLVD